jgi:hypothetical protein
MLTKTRRMLPDSPPVGLGVIGLGAKMSHGGIYAVEFKTELAHCPLYAGCLQSALDGVGKASVLVSNDPDELYSCMSRYPQINLDGGIETGNLQIFVMQPEFQKNMFRFGVDSFVYELSQFDLAENSFLIIDQAESFLTLDVEALAKEQLISLSAWMQDKSVICLLGFSSIDERQSIVLSSLREHLKGVASIGRVRGHLELAFDHWQSTDENLTGEVYRLAVTGDAFLNVVHQGVEQEHFVPFTAPQNHALRHGQDEHSIDQGNLQLVDAQVASVDPVVEEAQPVFSEVVRPFNKYMYVGRGHSSHAGKAAVPRARRAVGSR